MLNLRMRRQLGITGVFQPRPYDLLMDTFFDGTPITPFVWFDNTSAHHKARMLFAACLNTVPSFSISNAASVVDLREP